MKTNKRGGLILLLIVILVIVSNNLMFSQTTLDNFNDNDYTNTPTWTVVSGTAPSAASGALVTSNGTSNALVLSTPFTVDAVEWTFTVKSSSSFNTDLFRYFFILKDNNNPTNAAADGYCFQFDGNSGAYYIYRLDNGTLTSIGSNTSGSGSSATKVVKITRDPDGTFKMYEGSTPVLMITTSADLTYTSASTQFQSIRIVENGHSGTYTVDDIAYNIICINPTSAGVIGNDQCNAASFNPSAFTSISSASGYTGTLEYKWQQSTTSASSGFSDIASTNGATYDPGVITQTTWYRRLARVNCFVDWSGAVTSNTVVAKVSSVVSSFDGHPVADTAYTVNGTAAFRVSPTVNSSVFSYQWQVSANNGTSWSDISDPTYYSGYTDSTLIVLNPTIGMNGYLYRCVLSNFPCNSATSNSAKLTVIQLSSFTNTSTTTCGTNLNNDYSFQRVVTVSGLPTPLGTSTGKYVLREVKVKLGNSTCKGNLSTYSARIKSPSGTTIQLFTGFTGSATSMFADITFRDHSALERVKDYSNSVQAAYFPFKIGYYAAETDNTFDDVNGQDPNGNWLFEMAENVSSGNEVSFQSVELVFGPSFSYSDLTASSSNNDCSGAVCASSQEIIIATNNGYSQTDPNYPGNTVGSCSWNGANNNSAWFSFTPVTTTARLSISGMNDGGSSDMQPIIVQAPSSCSAPTIVPTGGCPDDESVNNLSYLSFNGGGTSSGNIYTNGITANCEFNLSGLTANQKYYLYIDGTGGASSTFYIEVDNNCKPCSTVLPVEFSDLTSTCLEEGVSINWTTQSELNNNYFVVEKSTDGIHFESVAKINGAGNSTIPLNYQYIDAALSKYSAAYYRIKQVDYDGALSYSDLIYSFCKNELKPTIYPNPFSNSIHLKNIKEQIINIKIYSSDSRLVRDIENFNSNQSLDLGYLDDGVYFFQILSINQELLYSFHSIKWLYNQK